MENIHRDGFSDSMNRLYLVDTASKTVSCLLRREQWQRLRDGSQAVSSTYRDGQNRLYKRRKPSLHPVSVVVTAIIIYLHMSNFWEKIHHLSSNV